MMRICFYFRHIIHYITSFFPLCYILPFYLQYVKLSHALNLFFSFRQGKRGPSALRGFSEYVHSGVLHVAIFGEKGDYLGFFELLAQ